MKTKPKEMDPIRAFEGKTVLVTGGTGSIGSEIVRQLLGRKKGLVRIFSNDEDGLSRMRRDLVDFPNARFLLGNIRDRGRLSKAVSGVDVVFHAAALKHVWACEHDPFEAVLTNVIGTKNIVEASHAAGVSKVVTISTDKAASPVSVLGATKLLAERLTTSAAIYGGSKKMTLCCVRFGNVLASRGSVVPVLREQIEAGGPVTVTDSKMTRFVMELPQSVGLVLKAATIARGGETFILKMPALKIGDLVRAMIELYGPKVKVKRVGIRPGEKMHEDLMSAAEGRSAIETPEMLVLLSPESVSKAGSLEVALKSYPGAKKTRRKDYASDDGKMLSLEKIKEILAGAQV